MTAKRFKIGLDLITIEDTSKEYGALNQDEVVDELNRLNDENEQLKQQLESEHQMLENAILLERTRMGQNALKQYKEAIK